MGWKTICLFADNVSLFLKHFKIYKKKTDKSDHVQFSYDIVNHLKIA